MLRLHADALNSRITAMADTRRAEDPAPDPALAGSGSGPDLTGDPRLAALRRALKDRPLARLPRDASLSEAAVLLALRPTDPLELLVIERAEKEGDPWSGHMALPGGRRQAEDGSLLATALRETREETGLVVHPEAVLGELEEVRPGSRRRFSIMVSPWVAVVDPDATITPAPAEVEAALWVPLPHLASEDAVDELLIELEGESRSFPALSYQEYVIWGLTHRIIEDFMGVARSVGLT